MAITFHGVKLSKWRIKAIKAFLSFIGLGLILALVYAQDQPYKYIRSTVALEEAFFQDEANNIQNSDEFWEWFTKVTDSASTHVMKNVEANCGYEIPLQSEVTIENETYTMYDPSPQYHACRNPEYSVAINREDGVFISGNHEVLSFGMFQSRSLVKVSMDKSRGSSLPGRPILTSGSITLNPMSDNRVIEICFTVPPVSASAEPCLLRDGFSGEFGSSFSWNGRYFSELSSPAYDDSSEARFIKIPQQPFVQVDPCYTYDNVTGNLIKNPPAVVNCEMFWTSPGVSLRSECLLDLDTQPTAQFSFLASSLGISSVEEMSDLIMGCSVLIDTPAQSLHQKFIATSLAIQTYLRNENMYGTFFLTESNFKWDLFAQFYAKQLRMHRFLDPRTRKLSVFAVLRNLGDESLFYALVTCTFTISISGKIEREFKVQYVPIIQYYYGLDGYPYIANEVVTAELFALLALVVILTCGFAFKVYASYRSRTSKNNVVGEGDGNNELIEDTYVSKGGLPVALVPRKMPVDRPRKFVTFQGDDEMSNLDDSDFNSEDSDAIIMHSLQNKRNEKLSKRMENTDVSEISLSDFGKILLPDIDDLDNMSSDSESESESESGICNDEKSEGSDSDTGRPLSAVFTRTQNLSIAALKKSTYIVTKHSKKSMKSVKKIIDVNVNKNQKYKMYFSIIVLVVFIFAFVSRMTYIFYARNLHRFMISDDLTTPPVNSLSTGYDIAFEDIIERFQFIENLEVVGRTVSVVCIFCFLAQFFSYLTFDKRFSLVTATLIKAVHDIVPMLVILLSVLFTYSVLGSTIYGRELEEFSYVGTSLSTLMIIMLGDVDIYEDMKAKHPILTMFYFWTFVILAVFIIFNMVLALIFTLYDEEYNDMKALKEKKRQIAMAEAERKRLEKVAAIKRKKFIRRNKALLKMKTTQGNVDA